MSGETRERELDMASAWLRLACCVFASWMAPTGWHGTVFFALFMLAPNRRVKIEP